MMSVSAVLYSGNSQCAIYNNGQTRLNNEGTDYTKYKRLIAHQSRWKPKRCPSSLDLSMQPCAQEESPSLGSALGALVYLLQPNSGPRGPCLHGY